MKLIKKGPGKVEIPTIAQGIVRITPPHIQGVDGEGLISVVYGNNRLTGLITFPFVKNSVVSNRISSLSPTISAKGGFRDLKAPLANNWSHFFKEFTLGGGDFKRVLTLLTALHEVILAN
jgi:hypothetical protein